MVRKQAIVDKRIHMVGLFLITLVKNHVEIKIYEYCIDTVTYFDETCDACVNPWPNPNKMHEDSRISNQSVPFQFRNAQKTPVIVFGYNYEKTIDWLKSNKIWTILKFTSTAYGESTN